MTRPHVSGVMPLDTSHFPDTCAAEGAVPEVGYDAGLAAARSNRFPETRWVLAIGAAVVLMLCLGLL